MTITLRFFFAIALFLIPALVSAGSNSFPAAPPSLVARWQAADLVVEADVLSVITKHNKRLSDLSIRTILKNQLGESPDRVTAVSIMGGCPYDFVLEPGMRVILFLFLNKEDRELQLYGAGIAAIEVDDRSFEIFASAFEKLPPILKVQDDEKRYAMLADWYVELMKSPESRWEGAWGISWIDQHLPGEALNEQQCEQLINVLKYESPPADHAGWVVEKVLHHESRDLDRLLLDSLSHSQVAGWQGINEVAVEHLAQRLGVELGGDIAEMQGRYSELNEQETRLIYFFDDPESAGRDVAPGSDTDREAQIRDLRNQQNILWREISEEVDRQCRAALDRR